MPQQQHWTALVAAHPIASLVVPCFGPNVDRVEIGVSSMRITFKLGYRHTPIPLNGPGVALAILLALEPWEKDHPDFNFVLSYEARGNDCGIIPSLCAIFEWENNR